MQLGPVKRLDAVVRDGERRTHRLGLAFQSPGGVVGVDAKPVEAHPVEPHSERAQRRVSLFADGGDDRADGLDIARSGELWTRQVLSHVAGDAAQVESVQHGRSRYRC